MNEDQKEIKRATENIAKVTAKEKGKKFDTVTKNTLEKKMIPQHAIGLSDAMVEGMYGQAFRLYNTGKYKESSQIFRILTMINSTEPKYMMGVAACFHMMKEYQKAVKAYAVCSIIDPDSPIPHYHASDCYIQLKDPASTIIALKMTVKRAGEKKEYAAIKERAQVMINTLSKEIKQQK